MEGAGINETVCQPKGQGVREGFEGRRLAQRSEVVVFGDRREIRSEKSMIGRRGEGEVETRGGVEEVGEERALQVGDEVVEACRE